MKSFIYLSLFSLFFLFACKNEKPTAAAQNQTPAISVPSKAEPVYTTRLDSLVKEGGGPCITGTDCMTARMIWPVVEGGKEEIRQILNDSIQQFLLYHLSLGSDGEETDKEKIIDILIADYKTAYEEESEFISGWALEVAGEMIFHDQVAALELFNYSYMGGAHGNYFTDYTNFDTQTGKVIKYNDIVKDTTQFKTIVKAAFLDEVKGMLDETVTMDDFFWGAGFHLSDNFKLAQDSIWITYNPYEAGPYALGSVELKIAYDALKGVVEL